MIAFIGVRSLDLLKPAVIEAPESMATTTVKKSSVTTSAISPSSKLASVVVVRGALGMDPQVLVDKALELLGGVEKFVPAGGSILVKPNVGFYEMDAVTDPKVVAAVVRSLRHARPARIVVGESSVRGHDTQHALSVTGVRAAAEQAGAEVRDMKKDPAVVALCEKYQRGTQYPENTCKNDRHECFKSYKPEDISLRRSNSPQQSDLTTLSIHTKDRSYQNDRQPPHHRCGNQEDAL